MNQNNAQGQMTFIPPMKINQIVDQLIGEGLNKEDSEKFLQAIAAEGVLTAIATVEEALSKNLMAIVVSEGVSPENMQLARYQFVAASSILTALTSNAVAYSRGLHPRFKRVQDET